MSDKQFYIVCRNRGGEYSNHKTNVYSIKEEADETAAVLAQRFDAPFVVFKAESQYTVEDGELKLQEYGDE